MPAHGKYGNTRCVRWDDDTQSFMLRCEDCSAKTGARFWPLTLEFWNPKTMQRCRACGAEKARKRERDKRRTDPAWAAEQRRKSMEYYVENKPVVAMKHKEYMKDYRARKRAEKGEAA